MCPDAAERIDVAAALIRRTILRVNGGDAELAHLLPDYAARFRPPEPLPTDEELTAGINTLFGAMQQRIQS